MMFSSLKLSLAGAACLFAASASGRDAFDPSDFHTDVVAVLDTLTILQLSTDTAPHADKVNVVNIFCPHHDMAAMLAGKGGAATLDYGTDEELKDAVEEYSAILNALGGADDGVSGFVMAVVDAKGNLRTSYTFNQVARQADRLEQESGLGALSPTDPGLIDKVNRTYINLCFGNS